MKNWLLSIDSTLTFKLLFVAGLLAITHSFFLNLMPVYLHPVLAHGFAGSLAGGYDFVLLQLTLNARHIHPKVGFAFAIANLGVLFDSLGGRELLGADAWYVYTRLVYASLLIASVALGYALILKRRLDEEEATDLREGELVLQLAQAHDEMQTLRAFRAEVLAERTCKECGEMFGSSQALAAHSRKNCR